VRAEASVRVSYAITGKPDIAITWSTGVLPAATHKVFCLHGADPTAATLAAEVARDPDIRYAAVSHRAGALLLPYGQPRIIYNGCDTARLSPTAGRDATRTRLGVDDHDILVGFLGRLADIKHPHAVAHAVVALRQRGLAAKGLFLGDHNGRHVERAQSIRLLLPDAIFLDATEAIGDPLAAMDVLLLPSYSEAFSLAKIEAWLTRTPVVATPVGAIPELEEAYGQLVVPIPVAASGDMLADAVLHAISRANDIVITRAHALAWRDFTVDAMVLRWDAYFQELLQGSEQA
jgi:glycosyltransferase involved in cell wall biosynthesis